MADNNSLLTGSICLSDIPKSQMRKVLCKDGKERIYLNIAVVTKKQAQTFTNNGISRTYTHFISCAPKKEERKEGENYILGDLETRTFAPQAPTQEDVDAAPRVAPGDPLDLPF